MCCNNSTHSAIALAVVACAALLPRTARGGAVVQRLAQTGINAGKSSQLTFGRFLGPWLARAQIQHAGQNSYGLQQLFLAISFFITFETLMVQGSKCLFARR